MKISILTLFPEMIQGFIQESILKRAQEKNAVDIELINIRDFAVDAYGTVDEKPYGGGAGMVMRVDCIFHALKKIKGAKAQSSHTILTCAKGTPYTQKKARTYTQYDHLIIIAGHYEGVDERVRGYVDEDVSVGDVVLTGGEIAAALITDSVVRLLPGVLKKTSATAEESFFTVDIEELISIVGKQDDLLYLQQNGKKSVALLEYPHYTRPEIFNSQKVPDVLLSGNHQNIYRWRMEQAYKETRLRRPDMLRYVSVI